MLQAADLGPQFFDPLRCIRCADQATPAWKASIFRLASSTAFIDHRISVIYRRALASHDVSLGLSVDTGFPHLVMDVLDLWPVLCANRGTIEPQIVFVRSWGASPQEALSDSRGLRWRFNSPWHGNCELGKG